MRTLWQNGHFATCDGAGRTFERGALVTDDATIAWIGDAADLPAGIAVDHTIDLAGQWVTPGLVDCHTHLVYAGQRATEFARRTAGSSYGEIARGGGGILNTVRATRAVDVDELVRQSGPRLRSLLQEGVTTIEIKSGYGLEFEAERAMLLAARALEQSHAVTVSTTFLGAHALPPEFTNRADAYIDVICNSWLPRLAGESTAAGRRLVDSVDAFCENIAFNTMQCDRLFVKATQLGLPVRLHAEQLSNVGGSSMAAKHRALSCDHLEYTTETDVIAMANAGTVAVLLPVAFYAMAEQQLPPIASLRRHGVPIAVASDANPGSAPGASLLLAMNMARRLFGLTGSEVLAGVTCHAARALGLHESRGSLAAGKIADFAVWSVATLDELGYWIGFNPCSKVVRNGSVVLERPHLA